MTLLHRARVIAQRMGLDVNRFPQCSLDYRVVQLILRSRIGVVVDVGANRGQYGAMLRRFGYHGKIVSFEPLREPLRMLTRRAGADPRWTVLPYALGDRNGRITVNVAGNGYASSSVLPMLSRHAEACPESRYVDVQEAEQLRLDAIWPEVVDPVERVFLKIDVQGYEGAVLEGAGDLVGQCSGLQMEVSSVPLYEGGLLLEDALRIAQHQHGMTLAALVPGFTDIRTGQMLQCDAVFLRDVVRDNPTSSVTRHSGLGAMPRSAGSRAPESAR
ncbi:FkbM family methyltransferase [Streptomyces xiangluensis]|uniref:FkbM family methyltransferase n=1 Tax=Streptomyces xiangluensis TaxID=2665720 RepID=A0ABV8Z148_9ACTN